MLAHKSQDFAEITQFLVDPGRQKVYIVFSTHTPRVLNAGGGWTPTGKPITFSMIWRFENGKKTIQS